MKLTKPKYMRKADIIAELKEYGVEPTLRARKATLVELLEEKRANVDYNCGIENCCGQEDSCRNDLQEIHVEKNPYKRFWDMFKLWN